MKLNKYISEYNGIKYSMEFDKISNLYYPHFMAEHRGDTLKVAIDLTIIEGKFEDDEKVYEVINWALDNSELLQSMWGELVKEKIDHLNFRRAV